MQSTLKCVTTCDQKNNNNVEFFDHRMIKWNKFIQLKLSDFLLNTLNTDCE